MNCGVDITPASRSCTVAQSAPVACTAAAQAQMFAAAASLSCASVRANASRSASITWCAVCARASSAGSSSGGSAPNVARAMTRRLSDPAETISDRPV